MPFITVPEVLREKLGGDGAEALVQLLNQAQNDWKADVLTFVEEKFERRLSEEIGALRVDVSQEFANLREEIAQNNASLREEVAGLRVEIAQNNASLREEVAGLRVEIAQNNASLREEIAQNNA
ncbi:MAG: LA_3696 family protein, partial [Anaerolineae bacterium]